MRADQVADIAKCDSVSAIIGFADEEHDEYKWLSLSEIENMPKGKVDRYFMEVFKAGLIKGELS